MSANKILEINPGDPPLPLEIRVLRKWVPYVAKNERKHEVCYMFVDINGNAIEATADITKERHFNSIINIGSTYTVDKYIAIPSRTYMPVVSHRTSLRMGNQTTFAPLLKESLPMYYYAFATYEDLSTRMEFPRLLTDYIGRIQNILPDTVRAKRRLRKLMIQDTQANNIEITLWGEKADVIGHDISPGNILAITSALVTEFKGVLQLESTNATAIAVNPAIPELQMYLDSSINSCIFKELGEPSHQQSTNKQLTIEALKATGSTSNQQNRFTCAATIVDIPATRTWFYVNCSESGCSNKAYPQETSFVCEDHGILSDPIFMYCVNALIKDQTGTTNVVFFNEAMTELLNVSCKDMIMIHGHRNSKILPSQIQNVIGQRKLLHVNLKKDGSIFVNKVEDAQAIYPTTPDPKHRTYASTAAETSSKKSKY